ncbi:MAG: phasin superfamily protein [Syntrophotalea acetylenica]|jgi:polyhydroxyalkanoate synthesis regulator phasin|uniref:Phasin superfamily protein n=1 Tax=Syntrophotalea acetylenica TaxID=29542 RepID=A0A1L3GH32_SYNAC|nr:phasin superfamily protein [Syntrophotalea acetylenica]APG25253.1 phasin superfamily protein [Syntrophotalea acetylenica]APG43323.1 phasin superfamily protein [Syntrophotalea acetylenica]MDD4458130.1 phasin superfamily protein [Syntrophotalea acetylenica]MDY0263444.1 phasin superfamily protein [Syntrophotalea acetylenica]
MIDLIEKSLLTGLGALTLTQKKVEQMADELKRRLNLSEEKGRELLTLLSDMARDNQQKLEEIAREEVQRICTDLGMVKKDELNRLAKKVQALEKELRALQQATQDDAPGKC